VKRLRRLSTCLASCLMALCWCWSSSCSRDESNGETSGSGSEQPTDCSCPDAIPGSDVPCCGFEHPPRCTYGSDPRPACRDAVQCHGDLFPEPPFFWWPTTPSCAPEVSGTCPALAAAEGLCDPSGLVCNYPDGGQCACVTLADGDRWQCAAPAPAPCPTTAPNLGTNCELDSTLVCSYGLCDALTYVEVTCLDGAWTETEWFGDGTNLLSSSCPAKCPAQLPLEMSPCTVRGLECWYGEDPRPACRTHAACSSQLPPTWVVTTAECAPLSAVDCPASIADATGACSVPDTICTYPDAAQCACVASGNSHSWTCSPPPQPGCPTIGPTEYALCGTRQMGLQCTYGLCEVSTFVDVICTGNIWIETSNCDGT
jgi:hypothetical protein